MVNDLDPVIHNALMQILATIFETGVVDSVALGDVMKLFGVSNSEDGDKIISFNDPGWIQAYIDFKEASGTPVLVIDEDDVAAMDAELRAEDELAGEGKPVMPTDGKLH